MEYIDTLYKNDINIVNKSNEKRYINNNSNKSIFASNHVQHVMNRWWYQNPYKHPLEIYTNMSINENIVLMIIKVLQFCSTWDTDARNGFSSISCNDDNCNNFNTQKIDSSNNDSNNNVSQDKYSGINIKNGLQPILWILRRNYIYNILQYMKDICSKEILFILCCTSWVSKRHLPEPPPYKLPPTIISPTKNDIQRCLHTYNDINIPFRHHGLYCILNYPLNDIDKLFIDFNITTLQSSQQLLVLLKNNIKILKTYLSFNIHLLQNIIDDIINILQSYVWYLQYL